MITVKDIAKKLGISVGTVSKALNDSPDISKHTKERVKRVAKEMGYIPNLMARSLVSKKTATIGFLTSFFDNPSHMDRLRGIQYICFKNHYTLISCFSEGKDDEISNVKRLIARKVDGLIVTSSSNSSEVKALLKNVDVPLVLMSEMIDGLDCVYVGEDDYEGMRMATEHLISLGHKNIAYFGNSPNIPSDINMLNGYRYTLEKYGIPYRKDYTFWGNTEKDILKKNVISLINMENPPTGILCWSDSIALNVMKVLREAGKKVPEDVSIVGYDNIELLSFFDIPLTTVGQQTFMIGQKSAEVLFEMIEQSEKRNNQKIIFTPELIIRNSTGPVKVK
ncbi:MAG: LacI family transcriptional regulator [bacterium]|nr:LacI family transcriptional regulator [bacterium]